MKMQKKYITLAGLFSVMLVLSMFASASSKHHCNKHHKKNLIENLAVMEQVLDLSAEQKEKIRMLRKEKKEAGKRHKVAAKVERKAEKIAELDPDAPDYNEKLAAMADNRASMARERFLLKQAYKAKLHQVLTQEQKDILKSLKHKTRRQSS